MNNHVGKLLITNCMMMVIDDGHNKINKQNKNT